MPLLLVTAAADLDLFKTIASKTALEYIKKETAAGILSTIINHTKMDEKRRDAAKFLIELGFDLNQRSDENSTAFDAAAEQNDVATAVMIIECSIARKSEKITGLEDDETARHLIEMIKKRTSDEIDFLRSNFASRDGSKSVGLFVKSPEFLK